MSKPRTFRGFTITLALTAALLVLLGAALVYTVQAQGVSISGRVTLPDGSLPVPDGTKVKLHRADGSVFGQAKVITSTGEFSFAGVPRGNYILRAVPPQDSPYTQSYPLPVSVLHDPIDVGDLPLTDPDIVGTVLAPPDGTPGLPVPALVRVRSGGGLIVQTVDAPTGQYRIGGLYPGSYALQAKPTADAPYWKSSWTPVTVSSISQTVNLTLTHANVYGYVQDSTGNPVPESTVHVYNLHRTVRRQDETHPSGYFAIGGLPNGVYTLTVEPPWYEGGLIAPSPITFTVPPSQTDLGIIHFLASPKVVTGTVTTNVGDPVEQARIIAQRVDKKGRANTLSQADGSYEIRLSEGLWALTVKPITDTIPAHWVYPDPPQLVYFHHNTDPESRQVDFTVLTADATVTGTVLLPTGDPPTFTVHVSLRNDEGIGRGTDIAADGTFTISVPHGTYKVHIRSADPQYVGPSVAPISLPPNSTYDLGILYLIERDAAITGTVRDEDGTGVEGIPVVAWKTPGPGWAKATTGPDGVYVLSVISGTWSVRPAPQPDQPYIYAGEPQQTTVASGGTVTGTDFTLLNASAHVTGTLVDEDGNPVSDLSGWATARHTTVPTITTGAPVDDGLFTLLVPTGTYRIRVHLPADSPYLPGKAQEIQVDGDTSITVPVRARTAAIVGALWDRRNSQIVPDLKAEVFAWSDWAWLRTAVDTGNGTYRLNVSPGLWALDYRVDPRSDYVALRHKRNIPVQEGQTMPVPLPVAQRDATISGTVLDPDGNPLEGATVIADGVGREVREVILRTLSAPDGTFTQTLPYGWYLVRAVMRDGEGWLNPVARPVYAPPDGTVTGITLQFRQPDTVITGTVTLSGTTGSGEALVWAWSPDDAYTKTTVSLGEVYTLNVLSNTTWYVGAVYQEEDSYWFAKARVEVGPDGATQDLVLDGPHPLPAPVVVTFDASEEAYVELADGTSIFVPAGAMPVSGTVTLHVIPIATLPHQRHANVYRYGYAFHATDATGQPITEHFNQDVVITFFYTDQELLDAGIDEDYLRPAYYSTTTSHWTIPESYVVDEANNRVVMQIDHFTDFALTGEGTPRYMVYLPLVMK